jgi:hypothetical protein
MVFFQWYATPFSENTSNDYTSPTIKMKTFKHAFTLLLMLISFRASAQNGVDKPYLSKSFSPDGLKNVKVETYGGNITVVGGKAGESRIDMFVEGNNGKALSQAEIKQRLEQFFEVNINKDAVTLHAVARRVGSGKATPQNTLNISFKVYVPAQLTSDLRADGGSVTLTNLKGEQKITTSGGHIHLKQVNGNADVRSSGGNIVVETFNGNLEAVSSGGNINAEQAGGKLQLKTSGGNIGIKSFAGNLEAATSGGNISIDITNPGERISLLTSAGNVNVKMPLNKGMDLDLKGGKVNIAMNNFNGIMEENRVQGKLNGGGILLHINTSGGNIQFN